MNEENLKEINTKALTRLWKETKGNPNTSPFSNRSDYDKVIVALERNVPMKVNNVRFLYNFRNLGYTKRTGKCNKCEHEVSGNYCDYCGQALDWGVKE